jgi:hypothetical protein
MHVEEYWKFVVKHLWPWSGSPAHGDSESAEKPRPGIPPIEAVAPPDNPDWYPRTFQQALPGDVIEMPEVFDPALKQFARAIRQGEPTFHDEHVGLAWRAARRGVIHHLLRIVATSEWKDRLILRGSVVLPTWLGDVAREPGDIDWVVTPASLRMNDPMSETMLDSLIRLVAEHSRAGDIRILATETAADEIWTYDRAPGRRIVFPWHSEGLPRGFTQVDFVFQEEMARPPRQIRIDVGADGPVELWAATPELSLAWKILWLETDMYPQGKDLYDAALLAEHVRLPRNLLMDVLEPSCRGSQSTFSPASIRGWDIDWENFQREYPLVPGTARDWQERLIQALEPTFAEQDPG